jgi:hypothetical protein
VGDKRGGISLAGQAIDIVLAMILKTFMQHKIRWFKFAVSGNSRAI